ncbi:MAG: CPBP family intramembrane metalloprotease [Chloroflexi bacterium]|nr:CPBP family intramembrane metalloprotease [Chloroflexota bacterium]
MDITHSEAVGTVTTRRDHTEMRSLLAFVGLTFGISWVVWLSLAAAVNGLLPVPVTSSSVTFMVWMIAGAWAPTVAALLITARTEGRAGVRSLLSRLGRWRVNWRWYGVALLLPFSLAALASVMHVALGGNPPPGPAMEPFFAPLIVLLVSLPIHLVVGGALAEEPGWRGYALPRLQQRLGMMGAGIVLGLIWWTWHWPTLLIPGSGQSHLPFGGYFLLMIAWSQLFVWLVNRARGSVLLAVLFHAAMNAAISTALPVFLGDDMRAGWIFIGLLWLAALATIVSAKVPAGANRENN